MWKKCELAGKEYLIKHTVNEALHKLHVTDLIYLWCEEITEDSLLQRCKEMNRLLETSDSELLNLVWSLVEGEEGNVISSFTDNVSGKQLNLQSNLDGMKFKIKFMLLLADHSQFFERVSCPLLITISEMEKRQKLLIDMIMKKDLEIAEYKLEGAKISRGAVETQVFDSESFSRKCAEELGTIKGLVQSRPSRTFTPFVRELLENTETATVITPRENHDVVKGDRQNCKKMGPIKLKSPIKAKKTKIYDDVEDEISDQEETKKEENSFTGSFEHKKVPKSKSSKMNARPKVKKVLSNL